MRCCVITFHHHGNTHHMTITLPTDRPFVSFEKISRANKSFGCVITEKIDGTNAQIVIEQGAIVAVGSRSRWIAPGKATDNFGFAGWVQEHEQELLGLGDGTHFGEWYGLGIQRGYGLREKRFALFNTGRWSAPDSRPACCDCVPVLFAGEFSRERVHVVMNDLLAHGSYIAPFMNPEGVVIYLPGPRTLLKETYDNPDGKWVANQNADLAVAA
jgi:hypothetical protein